MWYFIIVGFTLNIPSKGRTVNMHLSCDIDIHFGVEAKRTPCFMNCSWSLLLNFADEMFHYGRYQVIDSVEWTRYLKISGRKIISLYANTAFTIAFISLLNLHTIKMLWALTNINYVYVYNYNVTYQYKFCDNQFVNF